MKEELDPGNPGGPGSSIRIESGLVLHGGVGTIAEARMTPGLRTDYLDTLTVALQAGHRQLHEGASAVDAVVAAVCVLEDSPLFNAGRGSNYDERGVITMDASLMRGDDRDAGAVAGVRFVRNPIVLARAVLERSEHLFLIGDGAEAFARAHGIEVADPSFFDTDRRREDLERARARARMRGAEPGHGRRDRPNVLGDTGTDVPNALRNTEADVLDVPEDAAADVPSLAGDPKRPDPRHKAGTVGAVALDPGGQMAAGTSTGGMANKAWGRVGDTPVIGAGTYASELCAVSCTGWGEYFIRNVVAYDVHARMAYASASLAEAVRWVIWDQLNRQVPGSGGLVAIDADGNVEVGFNTPGMYRGWVNQKGEISVEIYGGPPSSLSR